MERKSGREKLAIQIGIGLIAGTFSIVPVASGAPVLDKVVSGGAIVNTGKTTTITSKTQNNVINWQDFSVAQGEKVQFDGGAKQNNYLNVVTGAAISRIDGAMEGGANVYLVNPNGVIFGKTASIDVGNLYVSTRNIGDVASTADLAEPTAVLASSGNSSAAGDIVNLGSIQANTVVAEGNNITFLNTAKVTDHSGKVNTNVTLMSDKGAIRVGEQALAGTQARAHYQMLGGTVENYTLISNQSELQGMSSALDGKYYLGNDINCSGTYVPVGTQAAPFTGVFDGQYFTVNNINVSGQGYGGLFGYVNGADIQNVGVVNAHVSAGFAGGIAGYAKDSRLTNVYNEAGNISSTAKFQGGGIVGGADNTVISSAYNTGLVLNNGGGIAGTLGSNVTIQDAYNTQASVTSGIAAYQSGTGLTITHVYTTGEKFSIDSAITSAATQGNSFAGAKVTRKASDYSGWDISNVGGAGSVWRIYEGQTLPLLRAFLTANGTVTTTYNYTHGEAESGSNGGKDLTTQKTYNGAYVAAAGVSYSSDNGKNIDESLIHYDDKVKNAGTTALYYTGQQGYDLIGNNVTIDKRVLSVTDSSINLEKVYDGKTDATEEFKTAFSSGSSTAGGVISGDSVAVTYGSGFKAAYADKNVGTGKTVILNGTLALSGKDASNYTLAADSATLNNTAVKGDITARTLYLTIGKTTGIDKTYDGNAIVTDADPSKNITLDTTANAASEHAVVAHDTVSLANNGTTAIYVADKGNPTANNKGNAGDYTDKVLYTGVSLTGADAGNYKLAYKDSANKDVDVTADGKLYLSGTVNKRVISADSFQVKDSNGNIANASKVYDGTSAYDSMGKTLVADTKAFGDTGIVSGDVITFAISTGDGKATFQTSGGQATSQVADATRVAYSISASGDETTLNNYTLNDKMLSNTGEYNVTGAGHIDKRTINVDLRQTTGINKIYDQTANVTDIQDKGYLTFYDAATGKGNVKYVDGSNTLVGTDGTSWTIQAAYAGKDVAYDAQNQIAPQKVAYTIAIAGDNAANYNLNSTNTAAHTLAATGTINPLGITANFDTVTKTYDGTTLVPEDQIKFQTMNGVLTGDTVELAKGAGFAAAYHSRNVNGDADGKNWVDYTGLALAGTSSKNYKLVNENGAEVTSAAGVGTITKKTLTEADLTAAFDGAITKVYDNTTNLQAGDSAVSHITSVAVNGIQNAAGTGAETLAVQGAAANYTDTNRGGKDDHTVNYTIQLTADTSGNYDYSGLLNNGSYTYKTSTTGKITKRTVTADIKEANLTKTYDAAKYYSEDDGVTELKGDKLVTLTNLVADDGTTNASTAVYDTADASTTAGDKKVAYTVALNTTDQTNYEIVDAATGKKILTDEGTVKNTLQGQGTINKRNLTLTFDKLTKTYDGTTGLSDSNKTALANGWHLSDGTAAGNTVISRDGTTLDAGAITANYGELVNSTFTANEHAAATKFIQYSDIRKALGDKAENYNISDTLYGQGTINKAMINSDSFKFDIHSVTREYNGLANVSTDPNDAFARSFVKSHYLDLGLGDKNPEFTYTITSAVYTDKNAGLGNKTVEYTIKADPIALEDYDIQSGTTDTFTATNNVSTITPRSIYASVTGPVSKTYDTTNKVKSGATELKGSDLIRLVDKDGNVGLLTNDGSRNESSAVYMDANAGTGKTVNYTIALDAANKDNYTIYNLTDKGNTSKTAIGTLSTNDNTIEKYGLKLAFDLASKDYDGTTSVPADKISYVLDKALGSDVVQLDSGYTAVYNSPDVKTANTVTYDGLKLTGNAAGNYVLTDIYGKTLADSATTGLTGTQVTTGNGVIAKYKLNDGDLNFSFNPITREYDATNVVAYQGDSSGAAISHYINGATVTVNGKNQALVYDASSAHYDGTNAGTHNVTFNVGLSGDNYDFTGLTAAAGNVQDANGNYMITKETTGEITKRKVYASLSGNDVVKTYDGTADVLQDVVGKVTFRDGDLLTSKDGVILAASVHYDDANAGTNKDVYYGVALEGDAASNYEIHDLTKIGDVSNDGIISQLTDKGKGTINKKELTVSFDRQEKDYDGNAAIHTISPTLSGLVHGETLAFDDIAKGKIQGEYGTGDTAAAFTADENVSRDANGNVVDKAVYYKGITGALDSLAERNTIASNYTIADTAYFNAAAKKGRLKPLAITQAAAKWADVSREYNADTDIPNADQVLTLHGKGLNGADIAITYHASAANYDQKDAGDNLGLTYQIDQVDKNLGNYQLSDDAAKTVLATTWKNVDASGTKLNKASITARTIHAFLNKSTDLTKVYDGTRFADKGNLIVDKDDAAVLAKDGLSAVITAEYDDADATIDPGAAHTNTRTVTYTLGGLDSNPNYSIGKAVYTGTGDIERRTLDVVADPVTVDVGAAMPPSFSGRVDGLVAKDHDLASGFTFLVDTAATTSMPGSYGVYGWYNDRMSGTLGKNYIFKQNHGNAEAFTVRPNKPGREYYDTINPMDQFTPDQTAYQQASKDRISGFEGKPDAALEYCDSNGSLLGMTDVAAGSLAITDSPQTYASRLSQIGIGEGNVVNLSSAEAANVASIEVDSSGTVVNLEIVPITAVSSDRQASAAIERAM